MPKTNNPIKTYGRGLAHKQLQGNLTETIETLAAAPMSSGVYLEDQVLAQGDNVIEHKLGQTPQGWIVTKASGAFGTTAISGATDSTPAKIRQIAHTTFSNPGSTVTLTWEKTPADGNSIALCYGGALPGTGDMTGPSMTGATFTTVTAEQNGTPGLRFYVYYAQNISSAGTTITFSKTASTFYGGIIAIELEGVQSSSIDQTASTGGTLITSSGNADIYPLTNITPSEDDTFYVGFCLEHRLPSEMGTLHFTEQYLRRFLSIETPRNSTVTYSSNTLVAFGGYINETEALGVEAHPTNPGGTSNGMLFACMNFKADTTGGGGGTVTVPHGLREVSATDTLLTLNAVDAVTVDLWVF